MSATRTMEQPVMRKVRNATAAKVLQRGRSRMKGRRKWKSGASVRRTSCDLTDQLRNPLNSIVFPKRLIHAPLSGSSELDTSARQSTQFPCRLSPSLKTSLREHLCYGSRATERAGEVALYINQFIFIMPLIKITPERTDFDDDCGGSAASYTCFLCC